VNNPLAAVLADRGLASEVVQEVRDRLRTSEPIDRQAEAKQLDGVIEALEDAETGGRRIEQIVKDLAKFARPSEEKARVRIIDAVQNAMRWLPATVCRAATVSVEDGGAPDVQGSLGQIEQVVVNLVTNAAKASKPGQLGVVIIRTSPGSPGMSRLDVIDRGVGIDPAVRDRIFDPFFTTRQVGDGKGMGLGLSICHSIVTAHGGTLTVQSEVGKGSTFRVELPAAPEEA
jgi:signal transduction histidine kinase